MRRSEKLQELSPEEQALVDALCSPPWPSIADAGVQAGFTRGTSYHVHRRERVQKAIEERMAEVAKENRRKAQAVLDRFERRSERDDAVGNEAGKVFLEAVGIIGRGAQVAVSVRVGDGDDSREARAIQAREAVLAGITAVEED